MESINEIFYFILLVAKFMRAFVPICGRIGDCCARVHKIAQYFGVYLFKRLNNGGSVACASDNYFAAAKAQVHNFGIFDAEHQARKHVGLVAAACAVRGRHFVKLQKRANISRGNQVLYAEIFEAHVEPARLQHVHVLARRQARKVFVFGAGAHHVA